MDMDKECYYDRYDKNVMERFAINTIGLSFDNSYLGYYAPADTNNFDYISQTNDKALEVTTVLTQNEWNAYIYEKHKAKGKQNLKTSHIGLAKFGEDDKLIFYHGGSMKEIKTEICKSVEKKKEKARKRLAKHPYKTVDLCICIQDGSLFDLNSFKYTFGNLDSDPFTNIFFITSSCFVCFNKEDGFKEYPRIINNE